MGFTAPDPRESGRIPLGALPLPEETWARGRGWTLWRSVLWLARDPEAAAPLARQRVADVIAEHLAATS